MTDIKYTGNTYNTRNTEHTYVKNTDCNIFTRGYVYTRILITAYDSQFLMA